MNEFQVANEAVNSISSVDIDDDNQNYGDLSDGVLRYIDQILMEEDMDDMTHMLQHSSDFRAKEQSFYEVLGQKYPPSPLQHESPLNVQYSERPDINYSYVNNNHHISTTGSSNGHRYLIDVVDPNANLTNYVVSNSSISSSNDIISQVVWNYRKGVDEASKFLPSGSEFLGGKGVLVQNPNDEAKLKGPNNDENNAVSSVPIEELDDVWIYTEDGREQFLASHIENLEIAGTKGSQKSRLVNKRSSGAKGRRCKKTYTKNEGIDLTSLLVNCAQSISAGDHRTANERLKQIRQHSSPSGDGTQRLAHYFADGLEARLAGTGSKIYRAVVHERTTSTNNMLAYGMSLASSTFRKISSFASNEFIMIKSEKATSVHIIDFGIFYGFQWPIFIKRVARREGGAPKLRITGIDFPQPGPRPTKRIKDTGLRLAHYAEMFKVPFEYNAIAKNWETVKVEDLKIEKGEFVAVTCSVASKNLVEDTVEAESPKTMFLDLIRKINPHIFIHDILNAGYSTPFFVTRFREALFHFSVLFDMVDTFLSRDKPERLMIERDVIGKGILNVVACEGRERVERPETYKQWQFRHLRVGFMQVPFERKLVDSIMYKVRNSYHRDFLLVEDNMWVFMGWKGRIVHAISCWQPV